MDSVLRASFNGVIAAVVSPMYWMAAFIVYVKYRKDFPRDISKHLWLRSVGEGLIAGMVVMMMITGLGLFVQPDPVLLWMGPAAWGLSLVHRRFFCFSYGAALVIALSWGMRQPVDVPGVAALVGLLHGVEGVLVWHNGQRGQAAKVIQDGPVLRWEKFFVRFWPIPVGILLAAQGEGGKMPFWWPVWGNSRIMLGGILPLCATLGYSERKRQKVSGRISGKRILIYGAILMAVAWLAQKNAVLEIVAVIFMVVGHEKIGRRNA